MVDFRAREIIKQNVGKTFETVQYTDLFYNGYGESAKRTFSFYKVDVEFIEGYISRDEIVLRGLNNKFLTLQNVDTRILCEIADLLK
jgi:hypothetical protein